MQENKAKDEWVKISTHPSQEEKPKEEPSQITPQPAPVESIKEGVPPEQSLSKEEIAPKPKIKKERKPRKKSTQKLYKTEIIKIDGKKVLMIPSGFEIKTSEGWKPVMMRADKISTK